MIESAIGGAHESGELMTFEELTMAKKNGVVSRQLVMERVVQWLDRVEAANVWNRDGGESFGELRLSAVYSGYTDEEDVDHVSVMCVEHLAEESLG